MKFASRDLTNQYISSSYQDVLQQYISIDPLYVLDGYGNVVFSLPSASIGYSIITSDVTSSMTVASSSQAISSSWTLGSRYSFTSDFAVLAGNAINSTSASVSLTSDFALLSGDSINATSASYALTSSYAFNEIKSGIVTASLFGGDPLTSSVVLNSKRIHRYSFNLYQKIC